MFCPNCGHDCKEENFCAKCGRELHAAEETDTPAVCNVGSERKDDVASRIDRVCPRIEQMYHASSIHYILAALSFSISTIIGFIIAIRATSVNQYLDILDFFDAGSSSDIKFILFLCLLGVVAALIMTVAIWMIFYDSKTNFRINPLWLNITIGYSVFYAIYLIILLVFAEGMIIHTANEIKPFAEYGREAADVLSKLRLAGIVVAIVSICNAAFYIAIAYFVIIVKKDSLAFGMKKLAKYLVIYARIMGWIVAIAAVVLLLFVEQMPIAPIVSILLSGVSMLLFAEVLNRYARRVFI